MFDLVPVEQKLVDFNGAELMAIKGNDGKIYVGVSWVCQGIGLNDNQTKNQRDKINTDTVLSKGGCKISTPTTGGIQEILCIELDFLPIWLAKINANIIEDSQVQDRLVDYQLKAKDVLSEAFLGKVPKSRKPPLPTWDRAAIREVNFAKEYSKFMGIRPERAMAIAFARIEAKTGEHMNDYRKLLPAVKPEEAELYTATQLGEKVNKTAIIVNLMLEELKLQEGSREPGKKEGSQRLVKKNPWQLTERGKAYGIMQDSAKQTGNYKWEGFQILWKEKVVELLVDHLENGNFNVYADV